MRVRCTLALLTLFTLLFAFTQGAVGFSDLVLDEDTLDDQHEYVEFQLIEYGNDDQNMAGYMRLENTGTKIVDTSNGIYSTYVISYKAFFNLTYDDGVYKGSANFTSWGDLFADQETGQIVKSRIMQNQTFSGDMGSGPSDTRTTTELLNYSTTWTGPNEPGIDDKWSVDIDESYEDIYWVNGVETDSWEDTDSWTIFYEYVEDEEIRTVLGTFDCKVYKSYNLRSESSSHYTLEYIPKGKTIPVKTEDFDEGKLVSSMELTAQRENGKEKGYSIIGWIGDEPPEEEKDDGLLGLGKFLGIDLLFIIIVLSVVLLIIITIIIILFVIIFKKKEKYDPNAQYTCKSCQNDLEYDKGMTEWFCGYCGEYTKSPGPKKIGEKEKYPGVKTGAVEEFYDEEDRKAKLEEQNEYFEYDEDDETETHYVEVPEDQPRREGRRRRPPEEGRRRRPPEEGRRRRPPEDDRRRRPPRDDRRGRRRPPEDDRRGRRRPPEDDRRGRRRPPEDDYDRRRGRDDGRRRRPPEDDRRRRPPEDDRRGRRRPPEDDRRRRPPPEDDYDRRRGRDDGRRRRRPPEEDYDRPRRGGRSRRESSMDWD